MKKELKIRCLRCGSAVNSSWSYCPQCNKEIPKSEKFTTKQLIAYNLIIYTIFTVFYFGFNHYKLYLYTYHYPRRICIGDVGEGFMYYTPGYIRLALDYPQAYWIIPLAILAIMAFSHILFAIGDRRGWLEPKE